MSFFGDELARQLEAQKLNAQMIAEPCKMSAGQIYKWLNAEQVSIWPEQLTALANAISSDSNDHARLVRAHLLDEKFGPGSELVRVEVDTPAEFKDQPKPKTKGERAIHFLGEQRIISRDVNDLVIDLARCLGADL